MMNRNVIGLGLVFFLVLTACDQATLPSSQSDTQGEWQLRTFELSGGESIQIPNPGNYTAQFTTEGVVSVQADCNRCNGGYEARGNFISIGPLGCTRAFCGEDSFFDAYVAALTSASSYVRRGDELDIAYSGGTMRFQVAQ